MSFPAVQTTATSLEDAANVTSHTVTLPSGIASGDLLLIFFSCDGDGTPITWPSGANDAFTEIVAAANGSDVTLAVAYRKANGSEPSTVEVVTNTSQRSAHASYRITGAEDPATQAPEASSSATGGDDSPNPASLSPTGGIKDYLWIASQGHDRDRTTDAFPTSYAGGISTQGSGANSAGVGCAERDRNIATEDPGVFTISTADQWVAFTIAVHPPAAVFDQDSFRIRNDDGTDETDATWKAAANVDADVATDTTFRQRFVVQETAGNSDGAPVSLQIQYRKNLGTWTNVTASSSNVKAVDSTKLTHGADTTQQVGGGTFLTNNNWVEDVDGVTDDSAAFAGSDEAEVEFALQIVDADVTDGDQIELRVVKAGGTVLATYTNTPELTIPIAFTALSDGKFSTTHSEHGPWQI